MCGRVAGFSVLYRAFRNAVNIMFDPIHLLACRFRLRPSGQQYMVPTFKVSRLKNSFVPVIVGLINGLLFQPLKYYCTLSVFVTFVVNVLVIPSLVFIAVLISFAGCTTNCPHVDNKVLFLPIIDSVPKSNRV